MRRKIPRIFLLTTITLLSFCMVTLDLYQNILGNQVSEADGIKPDASSEFGWFWRRLTQDVASVTMDPDTEYIEKRYARETPGILPIKAAFTIGQNRVMSETKGRLTMQPSGGRLGNLMFKYASLKGIAGSLGMTPVISPDNELLQYFDLDVNISDVKTGNWETFEEQISSGYDYAVRDLDPSVDTKLIGYFQSWRYFSRVQSDLRKEFTFKKPILSRAVSLLRASISKHFPNRTRAEINVVGVHVRRGDMLEYKSRQLGYVVASKDYLQTAMTLLSAPQPATTLFVIATDDVSWSEYNLPRYLAPSMVSRDQHPIVDLALLTLCDHVIMTVGTFGWWASFLAGGKVIYYGSFPRPYSLVDSQFRADEYFHPHWTGIG